MRWQRRPGEKAFAAPALVVLAISTALTIITTWLVWQYYQAKFERLVDMELAAGQQNIVSAMQLQVRTLRGVRAFFESSERVEPDEFARYVRDTNVAEEYQSIGYAKRVTAGAAERELFGGRRIWPEARKAEYFPVQYLGPETSGVDGVLGYDLGSGPLGEVLALARDTGEPAIGGKLPGLGNQPNGQEQFLIVVAVYRGVLPDDATAAQRREAHEGFAFMQVTMRWFFNLAVSRLPDSMNLRLYDGLEPLESTLLYSVGDDIGPQPLSAPLKRILTLDLYGQVWLLQLSVGPGFGLSRVLFPLGTMLFGFLASGLIYWVTWRQARGRHEAEGLLHELEASQDALLEANRTTRDVLESISEAFLATDAQGKIMYANPQASALLQIEQQRLLGLDVRQALPFVDDEEISRQLSRAVAEKVPTYQEFFVPQLSIWIEVHIFPSRGGGIGAYLRNITERRESERQLEESEQRFKSLFQYNPDAVFTVDFSGRLVNVNPATERITGFRQSRLRGQKFDPLLLPEYVEPAREKFKQAARGESIEFRSKIRRRDREIAELQVNAGPIVVGGNITGVFVVARDITEEQVSKRKLAQSEAAAHFAAEASAKLSASLDYRETMQSVVQVAVPFLADGACVSLRASDDDETTTVYLHQVRQKSDLIAQLAAGLCEFCFENTPLKRERATLYLPHVDAEGIHNLGIPPDLAAALPLRSIIMVPLYYRSESLGAMTLVATEGEREFGQEDLALARDFGRRISAAIENAVLYRRVQKAVRARDEFLSIGSHELKTPVTSIQLQVQLLMASLRENPDANVSRERILRSLESTDAQISRLVRLINELLDVSRLTTGNLRLEREPADFAALVGEVVGRFQINHSNVPLVFDGPQPVRGQWDKMRLEQVATNLISNAIKYGNGKEVTVRVYREGDRAKLTVRDLGIGIPESDIDRIFGRFERAVSARNFAGLGMGLYIVKQIVEAHGGTIHVESQPGKGSTFTVELLAE